MPVTTEVIDQQLNAIPAFQVWFTRREITALPEIISAGETIKGLSSGLYQGTTWLLVLTDRRVLFLDKGMLFGLKQVELPLSQISGLSHKIGLLFGKIDIHTSGGHQEIDQLPKTEVKNLANVLSDLVAAARTPAAQQPTSGTGNDVVSQLERLAVLKEKGILSEAEFADQKRKILAC
jgi:hypothetical protein